MANDTSTSISPQSGRAHLKIDSNKTLAAADSGVVHRIVTDGLTLTLPASATVGAGFTVVFQNGGASNGSVGSGSNGSVGITLTPASGDGVTGGGWTAAINKGVQNIKANSQVGDEISLVASGANTAAAWMVREVKGAWTRTP